MKKSKIKFNFGYSLIEMLVYISIFSVLAVLVVNSLLTTTKSFAETKENHELLEAGLSAMERISREIRGAESVDFQGSILDVSPGVLKLNTTDSSGNPKTVRFYLSGSVMEFEDNGALAGSLTSPNIEITNLVFREIATAKGIAVKAEMTARYGLGQNPRSENFYNTIILRGAY